MECSKAINAIGGFFKAPWSGAAAYMERTAAAGEKRSLKGLAEGMFGGKEGELLNYAWKGKDGAATNINLGKVAAAASGLGIGYRFLSGGGVYRDKNGNTDIAGIPFV